MKISFHHNKLLLLHSSLHNMVSEQSSSIVTRSSSFFVIWAHLIVSSSRSIRFLSSGGFCMEDSNSPFNSIGCIDKLSSESSSDTFAGQWNRHHTSRFTSPSSDHTSSGSKCKYCYDRTTASPDQHESEWSKLVSFVFEQCGSSRSISHLYSTWWT